ncbi:MAG: 4-(cytidine 5'-diphospho)-2-C-methyl-D-erythritol kinase, partial [Rhodobacteraceae bacterium]|nr:4-(cytidine 5'-diphospho)-2-C-methyl-D-erythritol kinase [Paracoccaceae bacterium]
MTMLGRGAMLARAKLNLCLHVVGQRPDGYHRLDSLVVFPEIGDLIEAAPSKRVSLSLAGPFAQELGGCGDNLMVRAAEQLSAWAVRQGAQVSGAALLLEKRLPVASGLGGGSADAAATLQLLCDLWGVAPNSTELAEIALGLGADVPACLSPDPVWMRGIGEELSPGPDLPSFWVVLVNPGASVSTPRIFAALQNKCNSPVRSAPERFSDLDKLLSWLRETRNDLQPPALSV